MLPGYHYDVEQTEADHLARAHGLMGDILPPRPVWLAPGPGAWLHGWATQLCGVQELLEYMMDRPEWTHRLMALLRDGHPGVMDQFESSGLLTFSNRGMFACDDLPAPDEIAGRVRLQDVWNRGESQEFDGVGPWHYREFLLHYQRPILERSGLTWYGCCENLTSKIEMILALPNLRRFVCSAWTHLGKLVEATGDRYCIEWRQLATDVVFDRDLTRTREHLREGLTIARDTPIMIVLPELETVDGNPARLREWAEVAKQVGAEVS